MPGRRKVVTTDEVLELLEAREEPFLSTSEIAEHLDVSKPTAIERLKKLRDEGAIRSREVAGNTPVWYLPELENRRLAEYSDGEPPEDPPRKPDGALEGPQADATREIIDGLQTRLDETMQEAVQEVVQEFEQELVSQQSEHAIISWEEKARREVQVGGNLVMKASVAVVIGLLMIGFFELVAPGVLAAPVPVLDDVAGAVITVVLVATGVFLLAAAYSGIVWVLVWTGLVDRAEQSAIGSWYYRLAPTDN